MSLNFLFKLCIVRDEDEDEDEDENEKDDGTDNDDGECVAFLFAYGSINNLRTYNTIVKYTEKK
jgi:hypothetical protein